MYSMPQQAVTKGYMKMEYFRAQPSALSSFVVWYAPGISVSLIIFYIHCRPAATGKIMTDKPVSHGGLTAKVYFQSNTPRLITKINPSERIATKTNISINPNMPNFLKITAQG